MKATGMERHETDDRKRLITFECDCGQYLVLEATKVGAP